MTVLAKKICMIGDYGVGKTSLTRRFMDAQFSEHYLSTIGVQISRKFFSAHSIDSLDIDAQLLIWDIEGKTDFKEITPAYLAGASGAIVVGDLTRPQTIEHLWQHLELIVQQLGPEVVTLLALNKADISADPSSQLLKIKQLQQEYPNILATYQTSAKTGQQVEHLFHSIGKTLFVSKS
jgi:small GTP-binding protein